MTRDKVFVHTTPPCMVCGLPSTMLLDYRSYRVWQGGALIQEVFPEMSPPQREQLKTGTHPACWEQMFADLYDDDEEDEGDDGEG